MKSYVNPRFFFRSLFVTFGLIALLQSCAEGQAPTVPANGSTLEGLIEKCRDKVVNIRCYSSSSRNHSSGSGFLIKGDNGDIYVVTNCHVLRKGLDKKHDKLKKGCEILVILPDGTRVTVSLMGISQKTGVVLLKTNRTDLGSFSFAKGKVKVGTKVVALGYPFDKGFHCTEGIVSANDKSYIDPDRNMALYNNYVMHTATTYPGSGGGPVVDEQGNVVGMSRRVTELCNLAISAHVIEEVVTKLSKENHSSDQL